MSKELKLPLNEMLNAQDLKNYASTYNANITDGLEGQSAQAASDFLTQLPKPELDNPVN